MQNPGHNIENRDRVINYDLNRVDYDWIEKQTNTKELK